MTDDLRSYHIIRQGLELLYPNRLEASQLRLLRTLALVIHGLIARCTGYQLHPSSDEVGSQYSRAGAALFQSLKTLF